MGRLLQFRPDLMLGANSSRTVMRGTEPEPVSALPLLTWTWDALVDRFSKAQEQE